MLNESLSTAGRLLREELANTGDQSNTQYPEKVLHEVNEIINRIETLKFKLDCPLWSNGYGYEDGVTWKA